MSSTEQQIEQEIQDKGLNAPRLTPKHIDSKIALEMYFTGSGIIDAQTHGHHLGLMRFQHHDGEDLHKPMETLTFCVLVLKNGFTVTGESACASPENFDAEIGRKIAFENARNKIWQLEGYLLKEQLHKQNSKVELKTGIDSLLDTRIPILDQVYDLCQAIEKCGASPELTDAVTKAGALRDPISELVKQALALGIGNGIVAVSHSDEAKASVCLAEIPEDQLFGEIKPQDPSELPELKVANTGDEPPVNGRTCGSCSGNLRDERLSNRENTYMLTQVLATENISQELRNKAELKLSELLDKIN
ncbi:Gp49 family protein [Acinetobacter modestus]|nr:Gp49 family protein [Acinetobacter modestus]MCM1958028.1 Gp49 family protein [Acinetobacter modestus]